MTQPNYWSLALADIPKPDYADMRMAVLPATATTDPSEWARTIFASRTMPRWVVAAMAVRQILAPLVGVRRAKGNVFKVSRVEGDEALIAVDDKHLNFRCGIGVDAAVRIVRVTTTVTFKGWRGRVYFWPVRLLHPIVVDSILKRSCHLLASTSTN
jgi:hypothetical protein